MRPVRVLSLSLRRAKRRGNLVAWTTSPAPTRLPRFARNDRGEGALAIAGEGEGVLAMTIWTRVGRREVAADS